MNEQPLITVIIPVYNTESTIEKCILSVVEQTYSQIEIIVVDDGSTDGSQQLIRKLTSQYNNILLLTKENGGQASARNLALDKFNGDYVCFLDSDDWLVRTTIEKLVFSVIDSGADIASCDFQTLNENGEVTGKYSSGIVNNNCEEVTEANSLPYRLVPQVTGKLFNKRLFEHGNNQFPEGIWYEDLALLPTLVMQSNKVVHLKEHCYQYFKRDGSTTLSFTPKVLDALKALEFIEQFISSNQAYERFREDLFPVVYRTLYITAVRLCEVQSDTERKEATEKLEEYFNDQFCTLNRAPKFQEHKLSERIVLHLVHLRWTKLLYLAKRFIRRFRAIFKRNK